MADAVERRRELRRKKILENAEERKRKIFGTTISTDDSSNNDETTRMAASGEATISATEKEAKPLDVSPTAVQASVTPTKEPCVTSACPTTPSNSLIPDGPEENAIENNSGTSRHSYTQLDQSSLFSGSEAQNGTVPDLREQLLNLNRLLTTNGNLGSGGGVQSGRVQDDIHQAAPIRILKFSMVPIFIALLVCAFLSNNLGYVVSNSISLPFLIWEVQHLWSQRYSILSDSKSKSGLLGVAFMLCGVRQTTISAYALIITIVKCFLEDFALYIFTVILWHNIIGLPVQETEVVESTQSDMPKEEFFGNTDIDNSLDF